ncbi:MAG: hypothetical protein QOJ99_3790 [Bryobacterales bacterium]|nr:hypothetical protein [Bryobacterales bacterium]
MLLYNCSCNCLLEYHSAHGEKRTKSPVQLSLCLPIVRSRCRLE